MLRHGGENDPGRRPERDGLVDQQSEPGVVLGARERLAFAIILGVALALRLRGLGTLAPWVDEANTWIIAREAPAEIVARLSQDSSPPLYYLALHAWMQLFGSSVVALRMLSVIGGLALVAVTFHVGRVLSTPRTGIWAAWLITTSPTQIYYSQQVRMYALLSLLALLSAFALLRAFQFGGVRRWCLYALSTALLLLTHNFAYHAMIALALIGLSAWRRGYALRPFLLASGLAALLYLPWLPIFWGQLTGEDTYSWFAVHWEHTSVWLMLLRSFGSVGPVAHFFSESWDVSVSWLAVFTFAGLALVARGIVAECKRPGVAPLWSALLLFVPYVSALVVSWALVPHFVPGRVDQMMIAPYALLAGAGLAALRLPRAAALTVAAILLGGALCVHPRHMPPDASSDGGWSTVGLDAELAAALLERSRAGDVVVCTSLSRAPLEYLVEQSGADLTLLSYPRSTAEHLGGQDDALLLGKPGLLATEAEAVLGAAVGGVTVIDTEGRRVHIVIVEGDVNRALREHIAALVKSGVLRPDGDDLAFVQRGTRQSLVLRSFRAGPVGELPPPR